MRRCDEKPRQREVRAKRLGSQEAIRTGCQVAVQNIEGSRWDRKRTGRRSALAPRMQRKDSESTTRPRGGKGKSRSCELERSDSNLNGLSYPMRDYELDSPSGSGSSRRHTYYNLK